MQCDQDKRGASYGAGQSPPPNAYEAYTSALEVSIRVVFGHFIIISLFGANTNKRAASFPLRRLLGGFQAGMIYPHSAQRWHPLQLIAALGV